MNKNLLNSVPVDKQKRNVFDLSHDLKFSFNMGKLIPTTVIDTIPGDTFQIGFENMLRFSALIAPIMHRVKVTTHYFFVPNRILWEDWEKWITGELDVEPPFIIPNNNDPEIPEVGINSGSLLDYMGLPVSNTTPVYDWKINALPISAYWKIFHEYYMDQNNDPDFDNFEEFYRLTDGDNSLNQDSGSTYYNSLAFHCSVKNRMADRAWQHDYFTSALPWAQKGEDVFIPLTAPVVSPFNQSGTARQELSVRSVGSDALIPNQQLNSAPSTSFLRGTTTNAWISGQIAENTEGDGTIANLRRAFKLQEWLEKNARGGTRYTESIMVHFGVQSSDKRLQRPEYLGGSVQNMVISEVLSTAQTLDSTDTVVNPVGQMSGHGISVAGSRVLNYYCEEHGWIIGLISVMPDTAYDQGLPKKFFKNDRFEYFWPSFQHIGEQAVQNKELYALTTDEVFAEETFGYVPRYTEYKFENSRVAGDFRDTLDFWHLSRKFDAGPRLNAEFIYPSRGENPFDRIFAVDSSIADTIYAHTLNKIKAIRPMARYGIPSI